MKRKIILPLLAVVFAIASAFTSNFAQSAYFWNGMAVDTGDIDNTTKPCTVNGTNQCTILGFDAYDNPTHAAASPSPTGLLKYN